MLEINYTTKFKKDIKRLKKRGKNINILTPIIYMLANQETLPDALQDHSLSGDYQGFRELHVQPDWLLLYLIEANELTLTLTRTGTHSDIFG